LAENLRAVKHQTLVYIEAKQAGLQSIATQYSLLFLLNLVNANFRSLSHCQIKLSALLDDELAHYDKKEKDLHAQKISEHGHQYWAIKPELTKGYRYFMSAYESSIVAIIEKDSHSAYLESISDPRTKEELTFVWKNIQSVCKQIIDGSISLLHQDPSSMVSLLLEELAKRPE
jgi:hypothetical protein